MDVGLSPAPSGRAHEERVPSAATAWWEGWDEAPRAVFPRNKHAGDEGIYLPDLTFTLNRQKVSQDLLSRLLTRMGAELLGCWGPVLKVTLMTEISTCLSRVTETAEVSEHLIACSAAWAVCCGEELHSRLTGSP